MPGDFTGPTCGTALDTPAPTLRAAIESDRSFCWELHVATLRDYVQATWGRWDEAEQRKRFGAWFAPAMLRIIQADGERVGFVKIDEDDGHVRLLSIAIAPARQRAGLGSAVIMQVIDVATPRPVWLQVLKVNPAKALYERLGFVVIGETATHWRMRHPA